MSRRLVEMTPAALRSVPAEGVVLVPVIGSSSVHGTGLPVGAEGFVTEDLCAELVDIRGADLDLWLAPPVRGGLVDVDPRTHTTPAHDLLRRTGSRRAIAVQAHSRRVGARPGQRCARTPWTASRPSGPPTLSWRDLLAEMCGGAHGTSMPNPEGDDDLVALLGYVRPHLLAPGTARSATTSPQRGQALFEELLRRSVDALVLLEAGEAALAPRAGRGRRPRAQHPGIGGSDGGDR